MIYERVFDGRIQAILSDAYVFEAVDLDNEEPTNHYFTSCAAWDTGAEITIISPRVVKSLNIKPVAQTKVMGIGGEEKVEVFKIHVGLPNGFIYEDLIVYCSDIDDYDILIGMDIISLSDFFLTNVNGNNKFCFRLPAEGTLS